jgi:hypothetical protein
MINQLKLVKYIIINHTTVLIIKKVKPISLGFYKQIYMISVIKIIWNKLYIFYVVRFVQFLICFSKLEATCIATIGSLKLISTTYQSFLQYFSLTTNQRTRPHGPGATHRDISSIAIDIDFAAWMKIFGLLLTFISFCFLLPYINAFFIYSHLCSTLEQHCSSAV